METVQTAVAAPTSFPASLVAFILAFQLVLATYDGWYSPIYFSEEDSNPRQNLPLSDTKLERSDESIRNII